MFALAACGGDESANDHGHHHDDHGHHHDDHGHDHDGEGDAGDEGDASDCQQREGVDSYEVGLRHSGEQVHVTFVSAEPSPPALDDNRWVVAVTSHEGDPVVDAMLTVTPWMPDHSHGTPVKTEVTATETPGEYLLDPVNLLMEGLWQVTIEIELDDDIRDAVTFSFCAE